LTRPTGRGGPFSRVPAAAAAGVVYRCLQGVSRDCRILRNTPGDRLRREHVSSFLHLTALRMARNARPGRYRSTAHYASTVAGRCTTCSTGWHLRRRPQTGDAQHPPHGMQRRFGLACVSRPSRTKRGG